MRILIGSTKIFYFHFKEFGKELEKNGIEYKIVKEKIARHYSRNFLNYFRDKKEYKKIINEFNPDFVIVDNQFLFAKAVLEVGKPLIIFLRGDYWKEAELRQTIARSFLYKYGSKFVHKMGEECFKGSTLIVPFCKYLDEIVKKHHPSKETLVLHPGINPKLWYPEKGMKLKHPCVGLVQAAGIWGKTKEMLILPKVMKAMPDVTFYWAGDGQYKNKVLPELQKCDNFEWLGKIEYPKKIREFLTEIDVYALFSGLDMTPLSLLEAQLLGKPVIATDVGGISETMENEKTGILVKQGNYNDWIIKLSNLINNEKSKIEMNKAGPDFVNENFNWKNTIKELIIFFEKKFS